MGYQPITALLDLDTIKERVGNTVFVSNDNNAVGDDESPKEAIREGKSEKRKNNKK